MIDLEILNATNALARVRATFPMGRIESVSGTFVLVSGLGGIAGLGDRIRVVGRSVEGEVIRVAADETLVLLESPVQGLAAGQPVALRPRPGFAPHDGWIGRVVDPDGRPLDGRPLLPGAQDRPLDCDPPPPGKRRALGRRLATGLAVFDTLLPLAQGQRIGLFAGSGVGKSTLLSSLATGVEADVIVIGLVGERGRELREFVEDVLGPEGMKRCIIVAATSDRAPQVRRRCAPAATAVAEHFRDQGRQVLLLVDSVTRFAEAHREVAVASGEAAGLRGFPASTSASIAGLCERAGPGLVGQGDITAIYTVLVAGSDMDEPVADILRGVLDGHVVLDRAIAERGRFPAVDVVRSVSRSLPQAASEAENAVIAEARRRLGSYARAELMIQSGLYTAGSDTEIDAAISVNAALDEFCSKPSPRGPSGAFHLLKEALGHTGDAQASMPSGFGLQQADNVDEKSPPQTPSAEVVQNGQGSRPDGSGSAAAK